MAILLVDKKHYVARNQWDSAKHSIHLKFTLIEKNLYALLTISTNVYFDVGR